MPVRTKLIIAYLGGRFCGWQRQSNGITVQGEIERAFTTMTAGLEIAVVGAGRTDAGVHAAGQVAHAVLPEAIPIASLVNGLNAVLPAEIRVRSATRAGPGFHARKSALGKRYTYRARWSAALLPWIGLRCARLRQYEHCDAFASALATLPGHHDVASFTVKDPERPSTERRLYRVWAVGRPHGVDLHFVGDGFLRYQVRRMVGALFQVGWGQLGVSDFRALLEDPRPGSPILSAPAQGLTLERVFYRHSKLLQPLC